MAITLAFVSSAKAELFTGTHDFTASTGDAFRLGLFRNGHARNYGAGTTNYSDVTTATTDEAAVTDGGTGYTAGGFLLTNVTPTVDGTAGITDFSVDPVFTLAGGTTPVLSSDGAFIYNDTQADRMISVHPFAGAPVAATGIGATFTLVLPAAAAATAVLRLA